MKSRLHLTQVVAAAIIGLMLCPARGVNAAEDDLRNEIMIWCGRLPEAIRSKISAEDKITKLFNGDVESTRDLAEAFNDVDFEAAYIFAKVESNQLLLLHRSDRFTDDGEPYIFAVRRRVINDQMDINNVSKKLDALDRKARLITDHILVRAGNRGK
jgi:hypothetical protein